MQFTEPKRRRVLHVRVRHVLVLVVHHWVTCCHVVAVLVLQNVRRNLRVLGHDEILVLKGLRVLRGEALQELLYCIFNLQRKIAKDELIVDHELVHRLIRHLNLKWKVVLDRCHFRELQELLKLLPVIVVIECADEQITRHLVGDFADLSELVDVEDLVFFEVRGHEHGQLHFVNDSQLRFEFYQVVALVAFVLELALRVTLVLLARHAARRPRHPLEVILEYLGPKIGVQVLPKQINLLIT